MDLKYTSLSLHNGISIPLYGLDTIGLTAADAYRAVTEAVHKGIRHIETSAEYGIESEIGRAILECGVPRKELFLTDEIRGISNTDATIRSANASMKRLNADYIDLLLLSWNGGDTADDPKNRNIYKAWKGLESLYKSGAAHAIGIVDFYPWQVEYLLNEVEIAPMVCYAGLFPGHPDLDKLMTYAEHRILTMAYLPENADKVLASKELKIFAEKHGCSPHDIVLQYLRQKNCAITMRNAAIQEVPIELSEDEMNFLDLMKDYTA